MNTYVTGATIKQLREERHLTQSELAQMIDVSSKTVSKWETAKGLPDISLLQPLAQALGISVIELMNGEQIINRNVSANMLRCDTSGAGSGRSRGTPCCHNRECGGRAFYYGSASHDQAALYFFCSLCDF